MTLHIDQPTLEAEVLTETRECVDGASHVPLTMEHSVQPARAIVALDYVGAQHGHAVSMGGIYPAAGRNGNVLVTEVAEVIDTGPVHEAIVIVLLRADEVTAEEGTLISLCLSLFLSFSHSPIGQIVAHHVVADEHLAFGISPSMGAHEVRLLVQVDRLATHSRVQGAHKARPIDVLTPHLECPKLLIALHWLRLELICKFSS